jgi:hypothetical protein
MKKEMDENVSVSNAGLPSERSVFPDGQKEGHCSSSNFVCRACRLLGVLG